MTSNGPHWISLGERQWRMWRVALLRSAGLPTELVPAGDAALIAALSADRSGAPAEALRTAYREAFRRAATQLAAAARNPLLREAVAWQSPHLIPLCLDKVASDAEFTGDAPPSKPRQRLLTVASYVQRYALKNETIGFFGPVAWARWESQAEPLTVQAGEWLLSRRTLHFEVWAVDALARRLSRDPAVVPWLRPRRAPQNVFSPATGTVTDPLGRTTALTPIEARLLALACGKRTVRDIADELGGPGEPAPDEAVPLVHRLLVTLQERQLVLVDLSVGVSSWPESELREALLAIPDARVRAYALAKLDDLERARAAVARAAGDPERLVTALNELDATFQRVAGAGTSRRAGEMYAGRTVVYEDTSRAVQARLGTALADELARPLELVLQSVRWLVTRAADRYTARFRELYERIRSRTGQDRVPLARLYSAAAPDLAFSFHGPPPILAPLVAELHQRWQRVLAVPPGGGIHRVDSARIRDAVAREFPATPPRWSAAARQSPDVMIAATDPAAVARGDYQLVLGEIHVGVNGLQSRPMVLHAIDTDWLVAAEAADHAGRIVTVPSKSSPVVNSRTNPSALLSRHFRYWTMYPDPAVYADDVLPAAALRVVPSGDRLIVVSDPDGREFDLLEMLGEALSGALINGFRLLPAQRRHPRVVLDRLVVARETWRFDASELAWCHAKQPIDRFRGAWWWSRDQQLPTRCFYRVPVEDKPLFVDFSSVVFVELLARSIRRTVREADEQGVSFTEVLPDVDQTWLRDADGRTYTSELRLVLHDGTAATPEGDSAARPA